MPTRGMFGIEGVPTLGGWRLESRPVIFPIHRDRAEVRSPISAAEARPDCARVARFFIDSAQDLPEGVSAHLSIFLTRSFSPVLSQSSERDVSRCMGVEPGKVCGLDIPEGGVFGVSVGRPGSLPTLPSSALILSNSGSRRMASA